MLGQLVLFDEGEIKINNKGYEFFFLISPSEKIKSSVRELKEKLHDQIGLEAVNLNSKAHISLFKLNSCNKELIVKLADTALKNISRFKITLAGHFIFDHKTSKSIVLKVNEVDPIKNIHFSLGRIFQLKQAKIFPHITIARSIGLNAFDRITSSLSDYDLNDEFLCDRITILSRPLGIVESKYKIFHEIFLK